MFQKDVICLGTVNFSARHSIVHGALRSSFPFAMLAQFNSQLLSGRNRIGFTLRTKQTSLPATISQYCSLADMASKWTLCLEHYA